MNACLSRLGAAALLAAALPAAQAQSTVTVYGIAAMEAVHVTSGILTPTGAATTTLNKLDSSQVTSSPAGSAPMRTEKRARGMARSCRIDSTALPKPAAAATPAELSGCPEGVVTMRVGAVQKAGTPRPARRTWRQPGSSACA